MLNSLISLIKHYKSNPEKVVFKDQNRSYSYKYIYSNVFEYSKVLKNNKKLNIGIFGNNSVEYAIADCGISTTKHTMVPIPSFFNDDTIANIIKDSNIDLIFTDQVNFTRIKSIFKNTNLFIKSLSVNSKTLELFNHKRIIYTSGTTNKPKGVIQSDKQMNIAIKNLINTFNIQSKDTYLSLLPISTLLEQICSIHITLQANSLSIFNEDISKRIFSLKEDDFYFILYSKPNFLCISPIILKQLVNYLEKNTFDDFTKNIKSICVGGSKSSIDVLNRGINHLKLPIFEGYGLSEFCSVVSVNNQHFNKIGTTGAILPNIKCKIINGEIVLSGPTLMNGYYPNKIQTDEFYTGDLGSLSKEGFLTVYGRKDDVLILDNGRNIHPEYIKQLLVDKINYKEIYIYQDDNNDLCFAISLKDNDLKKNLINFIKSILPEYILPKKIYVLGKNFDQKQLLSTNGKVNSAKISNYLNLNKGEITNAIL